MSLSGIYCIENLVSGKKYIGQSANLNQRKWKHFWGLRHNRHENSHLQRAWTKYGEAAFEFKILIYCEPFELTKYEQFFVDYYGIEKLYNICTECVDSTLGIKASDETKKKISIASAGKNNPMYGKSGELAPNYGKTPGIDTKKKLSEALIGNHNMGNEETHYNFNKKASNSSSKYFGVSASGKKYKYWQVRIHTNKKIINIGTFKTELEAAIAYDNYVKENSLSNRKLNFS